MKILREGKMINPITFECDACECEFIAGQGEYKYVYIPWDWNGWEIYQCECPYCKKLVEKELRLG